MANVRWVHVPVHRGPAFPPLEGFRAPGSKGSRSRGGQGRARPAERGSTLILALILLTLASMLGMAALFATDVDLQTSRNWSDSVRTLNDTDSAVQEVLWRLNLVRGAAAPPAGSQVTVNGLVNYDASLDYDLLGALTNGIDDDGDGRVDMYDVDELNLERDWAVRILLAPTVANPGSPWQVKDTSLMAGPPWGSALVEATIQPLATWRTYSSADVTSEDVLTVRFKLDTDTKLALAPPSPSPQIVFYDPDLAADAFDDPNTLIGLGGDGDPTNDSPYNITWSNGAVTRRASGTPVLLIRATARVVRGGRVLARRKVEVEANRPFRRVMNKALCGCDSLVMSAASTDSYSSLDGPYGTGPTYQNGDVGSNGTMKVTGTATIGGNAESRGDMTYAGTAVLVSKNATSGGAISGANRIIVGTETSYAMPSPSPCVCAEPDAKALVDRAKLSNDNATIQPPQGSYVLKLTGSETIILSGGTYYFDSVSVSGSASIQVGRDLSPVDGKVDAAPLKPVIVYVAGNVSISGKGVLNDYGAPTDFQIIASASSSSTPPQKVSLSGTSEFRGTVFAPYTDISITGANDFYGSAVGKTVTRSGGGDVHYDHATRDALFTFSPIRVIAWREVD